MSTCISPQKRSSGIVAPVGHTLGNKLLLFAKSRLPVPNKPKTRNRHTFINAAPIPFAPLVDTYAFQPPPPYSAHPDHSADSEFLPVPHNTPEISATTVVEHSVVLSASTASYAHPIGLGLDGVEKGDGGRFDGLGRLSGGFRAEGTNDALREQVQRMLIERSRRRRTRASEQPTMRHDVFYASVEVQACENVMNGVPVKIRIRRKSAASPTPGPRGWEGVRRATVSSELKRAASLDRRASLSEAAHMTAWRV
ncbi:hypothetical protein JVT61DRAFT_3531 [Boletus reticuloceps]|uniref:Uncharacterized protein n=1 Tax=Boletus reticuloceps TaxID=495285 RepID=A0A8I3AA32_9AGAM|nr:hypothetical protein JVT61DRAFT_3531 [Boletus reticuloceps]